MDIYLNAFLWDFEHLEELYRIDAWYERVALHAFEKHNDKHLVRDGVLRLSEIWHALFEIQAPSIKALF